MPGQQDLNLRSLLSPSRSETLAPLGLRSANPEEFDSKMRMWINAIEEYARNNNKITLSLKDIHQTFVSDTGIYPDKECIRQVLNEMKLNICQKLDEIQEIGELINKSIVLVTSKIDKINGYESEFRNVRQTVQDALFQVEGEERVVQVKSKNHRDTCQLIEELVVNLRIPDHVHDTLNRWKVQDDSYIEMPEESSIGPMIESLNQLEKALQYEPNPILQNMLCVREQKAEAYNIGAKFCKRFRQQLAAYVNQLLTKFSQQLPGQQLASGIMACNDILHEKLFHLEPIVEWVRANDEETYEEMCDSCIESFIELANFYNAQDGLYSLYLLVSLSHYRDQSNSLPFLAQIYFKVLVEVKRNFDHYMQQQLQAIRDAKAPKTSKCGVLGVVKNFEQFVTQVESLFKNTGARRTDIDRWYHELGRELFRTIDRTEHSKTPKEMIRLENYNYLHDVFSRYRSIKAPHLENLRKEADLQYKEARKAYVTCYFGRPLEKLNKFFEGVEAKLKLGVKEEEISFQLAFSKQELRKVLQQVTLKEVRKGLEEMYRRIEKHAYEPDSNLIQAIWRDMQDEFLSQYKEKQGMIERCYPSSNLSLTFTIDDLIEVFKHIAQSH